MKRKIIILAAAVLLLLTASTSLADGLFERHEVRSDRVDKNIVYWVYVPEEVDESTPLVVFLHGGGQLGEGALDAVLPRSMISGKLTDVPAVLVIPQMPWHIEYWEMLDDAVQRMTDRVMERCGIRDGNIALCGFSMGAIGTMDIANRHPGKYAKILVAAGRVREQVKARAFEGTQVRFYVGKRDHDINSATIYQYKGYLEWAGADVTLTELDTNHLETEQAVFTDREILNWLFSVPAEETEETEAHDAEEITEPEPDETGAGTAVPEPQDE